MIKKRTIYPQFFAIFSALLLFSTAGCVSSSSLGKNLKVGFDLDDTLVFSTPAFGRADMMGVPRFSPEFWKIVNSSDAQYSVIKKEAVSLLGMHRQRGDMIFIVTARHPFGIEPLEEFLQKKFGIEKGNIFFETEGKRARIRTLDLDVFYGDSDSDISDALSAGAVPYRVERSTASSCKKDYNPGRFGEDIIEGSLR